MVCAVNTIDSNVTGLAYAEEDCPKILPVTPIWQAVDLNSYADFGTDIKTVASEPITQSRQDNQGTVTDIESAGGFSLDLNLDNSTKLNQGFFYLDIFEKYNLKPMNGTANPCTSVAGSGVYNVTTSLAGLIRVGDLVKTSGFASSANNALGKVTSVVTTTLTTNISTVVDASPASAHNIRVVGFEFDSGDLVATISSGTLVLTSSAKTMTELGLKVGEGIYIGGDAVGTRFANGTGYARVLSVSATTIVCDVSTGLITADTGTGKTIRIFFGSYQRNADAPTETVKIRTYQLERQLGNDGAGIQSEILVGCYANDMSIKITTASKITVDYTFIGLDGETRDGATGIKSGTRLAAIAGSIFNTSKNMIRSSIALVTASLSPAQAFSFATDISYEIKNGVTLNKAIATVGGISSSLSNFKVSGAITAYFQTVAALSYIKNNTAVTINTIFAKENSGFMFDIPLATLGGGKVNVTKDKAITVPLTYQAFKCPAGYTFSITKFHYLPTIAVPA